MTLGGPELLTAGACVFIFILALSAYFEADIRWLHFFQAWMYIATTALCLRRNRWGYFIGISAAGFWDYVNLFVTTFFLNGLHWLRASHPQAINSCRGANSVEACAITCP